MATPSNNTTTSKQQNNTEKKMTSNEKYHQNKYIGCRRNPIGINNVLLQRQLAMTQANIQNFINNKQNVTFNDSHVKSFNEYQKQMKPPNLK